MYFLRRTSPVHLRADGVLGLRRSLNAPVVSTPEFPTGPAEAAILSHRERDGRVTVTIGVRSARAGETALWDYGGDLAEASSLAVAVDAALSFAEGMGFLFDEEELGEGAVAADRDRARADWEALMGTRGPAAGAAAPEVLLEEEVASEAPRAAAPRPRPPARPAPTPTRPAPAPRAAAKPEAAEVELLEELDDLLDDGAGDLEAGTPAFAPAGDTAPGVPLSKFRAGAPPARPQPEPRPQPVLRDPKARAAAAAPGKAAETPEGKGRAALGRLKLVRRRRGAADLRKGWLQRVLASF